MEKFKNSCIMDEREAWQPKIFYSSGPEQGLPEPFPPPTHMRRKERGVFNRGPLYTPGMMANGMPIAPRRPLQIESAPPTPTVAPPPRPRRAREDDVTEQTNALKALVDGMKKNKK